jgi:hypothetical protein
MGETSPLRALLMRKDPPPALQIAEIRSGTSGPELLNRTVTFRKRTGKDKCHENPLIFCFLMTISIAPSAQQSVQEPFWLPRSNELLRGLCGPPQSVQNVLARYGIVYADVNLPF